ncbi:cytochrome P450 [Aeromicrobium sp.]|uniref:cytochrome P450 n=1 Tax=Aeromicrobium sp. TaxID=1871063 RepID=UPI003C5315EF
MATIAAPRPVAPRRRVIPLVGQTLAYFHDPLATMRYHYDTNGPVSDYTFVGRRWTMLLGPDACEVALRNADKAFANAGGWGYLIGPFFERGLMLLDFEEHHHHRRILQEAFTRDRIADYASTLGPAVEARLDAWRPDPAFQAYPALKDLTLDLATQIFMGGAELADADELARVNQAFIDCVQAGLGFVRTSLPGTKWRRGVKGRRLLEEFFSRQVAARRASGGTDLFSALCHIETDDGHRLSDDDIVSHMIFLLMAAHDTSTITVTTMMQHLGQHQEWQERCRAESLALSAHPTLDEIDGLTSLDLVMKECLRLVPPVPGLARQAVKDTEVLGQHIPAGRLVSVGVHLSHHMPELWPDPERFDPERFAEHRREDKVHRYAWEPFGGGVHKCIGLYFGTVEVKMIVHQMLQRFAWTVDPDYVAPMNYHSLPFPKDGLPVNLRPLDQGPPA